MNWKSILIPSAYLALFALSSFALIWWEWRKRGTRAPFTKDLRLLRMAGETQLKEANQLDERFVVLWLAAAVGPCILGLILLAVARFLPGPWPVVGAALTAAIFLSALAIGLRRLVIFLRERGDRYLGYFAERVVGEYLEPLKLIGWRIFHNVPCEIGAERFNIDHVAVGPGGVFAIETAARRKGATREGRDDYKVFYDGEQLSWPWGEDQHGLDKTIRNAKWLKQWLEKTTAEKVEVSSVLAIPGWYVEANARAAVRVVNPTWLPDMLTTPGVVHLNERQIDLCARQLEQRCRDVTY
jgi:hypothetical protein